MLEARVFVVVGLCASAVLVTYATKKWVLSQPVALEAAAVTPQPTESPTIAPTMPPPAARATPSEGGFQIAEAEIQAEVKKAVAENWPQAVVGIVSVLFPLSADPALMESFAKASSEALDKAQEKFGPVPLTRSFVGVYSNKPLMEKGREFAGGEAPSPFFFLFPGERPKEETLNFMRRRGVYGYFSLQCGTALPPWVVEGLARQLDGSMLSETVKSMASLPENGSFLETLPQEAITQQWSDAAFVLTQATAEAWGGDSLWHTLVHKVCIEKTPIGEAIPGPMGSFKAGEVWTSLHGLMKMWQGKPENAVRKDRKPEKP